MFQARALATLTLAFAAILHPRLAAEEPPDPDAKLDAEREAVSLAIQVRTGQTLRYRVTQELEQSGILDSHSHYRFTFDIELRVKKVTADEVVFTERVKRVRGIASAARGEPVEFDSKTKKGVKTTDRKVLTSHGLFVGMAGQSCEFTMNRRGLVTGVKGWANALRKSAKKLRVEDDEWSGEMLTDDSALDLVRSRFALLPAEPLPAEPLQAGDAWALRYPYRVAAAELVGEAKLLDANEDEASIEYRAELDVEEERPHGSANVATYHANATIDREDGLPRTLSARSYYRVDNRGRTILEAEHQTTVERL